MDEDEDEPEWVYFRRTVPFSVSPAPDDDGESAARAAASPVDEPAAGQGSPEPRQPHKGLTGAAVAWGATGAAFVALAIALPCAATGADLRPFRAALLTAAITVAIFAVSLSFVIFQLSPYRVLIPGASNRHIAAATAVLALALAPMVGLAFSANASGHVAVAVLPLLLFASVLLVRLAQREATPSVLLNGRVNKRAVRARGFALITPLRRQVAEFEALRRPPKDPNIHVGPPMHEIFHGLLPPPHPDDPLELLVGLATAAVSRGDTYTYGLTVTRAIAVADWVRDLPVPDTEEAEGYRVHGALTAEADRIVAAIGKAGLRDEHTSAFADLFIEQCLGAVREAVSDNQQGASRVIDAWDRAVDVAHTLVERGFHFAAIAVLMVGRLAAEQGMTAIEDWQQRYYLNQYPNRIEGLGHTAVAAKDTDFLYRCLDAIAWIGCAAVRENDSDLSAACLQALAQLGREARAAELECFWQRCLLTPTDHVLERIGWMASWLDRVPSEHQQARCNQIAEALSRLNGHRCKLTMEGEDGGQLHPKLTRSSEPHKETIDDNGIIRTIDYSDPSMLKEYVLR